MARYAYTAIDKTGKTVSGTLTAPTVGRAHLEVTTLGFQPVAIEERRSVLHYEVTRKKVKRDVVMNFSRQLGVFVRSGIPIVDALDIIATDMSDKLFKKTLLQMNEALQAGDTFALAARAHPEAFPPYYLGMLESAELGGNLDSVLTQLSDYMERDSEARSKVIGALIYPSVVLFMAIVVVIVLAAVVMPKFKTFFASLNAKLPLATKLLIDVTNYFEGHWEAIFGAIVVIVIGTIATYRSKRGKSIIDSIILRIPIIGDLVRHVMVERVCRILSSMTETGVPLPDAMTVTAESVSNNVFRRGLDHIRGEMLEGRGLAEPVAASGILPSAARQMIRVGEETGTLEEQLHVAANYYERELDVKIKRFTGLFEPAVIIVMGVVVGFVAVALISAMYGIYRQVNIGATG